MAFVGLRYAVFAPITAEVRGQEVVYGTGVVVGKMMQADVTYERNTDPLYADDTEAENDNSITGGTVTVGVDDILDPARVVIFGDYADGEKSDEYEDNSEASPYGGFGYMRVRRKEGKTSFVAYWLHKVQFGSTTESAQTKGQNIAWQTPTINGNIMGVNNNADGKMRFRRRKSFDTAAEAIAWLNERAKVTDQAAAAAAAEA